MTVVETNEDMAGYGEERYSGVAEKALPASTQQREEAAADSEGIKHEVGPVVVGDIAPKIGSNLVTKTVSDTNGDKPSHEEEQDKEGGEKRTDKITPEPEIESRATQSVQDTVTITESDTIETQVCYVQACVVEIRSDVRSNDMLFVATDDYHTDC